MQQYNDFLFFSGGSFIILEQVECFWEMFILSDGFVNTVIVSRHSNLLQRIQWHKGRQMVHKQVPLSHCNHKMSDVMRAIDFNFRW